MHSYENKIETAFSNHTLWVKGNDTQDELKVRDTKEVLFLCIFFEDKDKEEVIQHLKY